MDGHPDRAALLASAALVVTILAFATAATFAVPAAPAMPADEAPTFTLSAHFEGPSSCISGWTLVSRGDGLARALHSESRMGSPWTPRRASCGQPTRARTGWLTSPPLRRRRGATRNPDAGHVPVLSAVPRGRAGGVGGAAWTR